jgi:hypothetical protein
LKFRRDEGRDEIDIHEAAIFQRKFINKDMLVASAFDYLSDIASIGQNA